VTPARPKDELASRWRMTKVEGMSDDDRAADSETALTPAVARALVENHRELLRFLERRVGRRDVAEDILQDAFARGFEKLESLRDEEAILPWFYRTLRNASVDYFRRTKSADRALARFAEEIETSDEPPEALRELGEEVCRCVLRLADTLKPEYAEALRRIEIDGIPVNAFADEQGISKSNAGVRVFRAREALRRQVAASCGTCAEHGCVACSCGSPAPRSR